MDMDPFSKMDYMPDVPHNVFGVKWRLETPSAGGRIVAEDSRSTIVYTPNASPYNEDEQRLARLFLYSREMLFLLKNASDMLCDGSIGRQLEYDIDMLVEKVEKG